MQIDAIRDADDAALQKDCRGVRNNELPFREQTVSQRNIMNRSPMMQKGQTSAKI